MSYEDKVERLLEKTADLIIPGLLGGVSGALGKGEGSNLINSAIHRGEISPRALDVYNEQAPGGWSGVGKSIGYGVLGSLAGAGIGAAMRPAPPTSKKYLIPGAVIGAALGGIPGITYGVYRGYQSPVEEAEDLIRKYRKQ